MSRGTTSRGLAALAVIVSLLATDLQAQWQRVETLEGITVQDFAITAGGTLYTSSDQEDGLYFSTDSGQNWERRDDFGRLLCLTLETAGEELYLLAMDLSVSSAARHIYRLQGPLSTLERIPSPRGGYVGSFCCSEDGWLYATITEGPGSDSVFLSTDRGLSWNSICMKYVSGLGKNDLRVDAHKKLWSQSLTDVGWYDASSQRWVNLGASGSLYSKTLRIFVQDNGDAYINDSRRVVRYNAATSSLSSVFIPVEPVLNSIDFWPVADGRLLVCERGADDVNPSAILWESTDGGAMWNKVREDLILPVRFLGEFNGTIYANHAGMLVNTRDHGRSFQSCNNGIAAADAWKFETRGDRIHVQARRYAISSDAGETWTYPGVCAGFNPQGIQITSDGTWFEDMGILRISRDNGQTWETPWGSVGGPAVINLLALDDVVLLALGDGTLQRSTDAGRSWTPTYTASPYVTNLIEVNGVLYGLAANSLILSTDRGESWSSSDLPASENSMLTGNERTLLLSASSVLWTSTDRGSTWFRPPLDKLTQGIKSFAVHRHGFFAALRDELKPDSSRRSVILSIDDGQSWSDITGNLPVTFTAKNFIPPSQLGFTRGNKLFVKVRGQGLYVYDAIPVNISRDAEIPLSLGITLWPTDASSEIRYRVNSPHNSVVTVYNSTGAVIHHVEIPADGSAQRIDVSEWTSGTYFLRAVSAGGSVFKEFVVLR